MYDVIIIGGGAAGLNAALYAGRGGMRTLLIEKLAPGGQVALTYEVDNYIGFDENPTGQELADKMLAHAKKFGVEITNETVKSIENEEEPVKTVRTRKNGYETRTIILAPGATPRKLDVDGEERLRGMGVSYCATCDGAFFKGQMAAVVGGGNTACEDALYLARFCTKVYLIHRREGFRAAATVLDKVKAEPKIEIITNAVVEKIEGDTAVSGVHVKNVKTGETALLDVAAVFIAVGIVPDTELAKTVVALDEGGFIKTDDYMRTSTPGIFAAGDARDTVLRQIITAAADGAIAAVSAVNQINSQQ
jgi:thioredoxin reductase (NADPH)